MTYPTGDALNAETKFELQSRIASYLKPVMEVGYWNPEEKADEACGDIMAIIEKFKP